MKSSTTALARPLAPQLHPAKRMPLPPTFDKHASDTRDWSVRPRKKPEDSSENRQAIRFKLELPVRYRTAKESGWGEIINISSSGALLTCDQPLPLKTKIELNIKWPVLLFDAVQLSLVAVGKVSRLEEGKMAVMIEKYEFRTCGATFFQQQPAETMAPPPAGSSRVHPHFQLQVANHSMQGIRM